MKRFPLLIAILIILGLSLSACNLPTGANRATPDLFATLAATAGLPVSYTSVPTSVAVQGSTATALPQPSATALPANTSTSIPTITSPAPTSTPIPTISSGQNGGVQTPRCTYLATYIADVTIPDDSRMDAGRAFTKIWRVRNDGTCTWGTGYPLNALVFYSGSQLGAPYQVQITGPVAPGQMLDIAVSMVAPNSPGVYTSEWMFLLDNTYFGSGPYGSAALYTRIIVGATPTPMVMTRINLPAGATSTSVDGVVVGNGIRTYVVGAARDQLLMASISSASQDLTLRIVDAGNMQVLASVYGPAVQAVLPRNGDYLVQVVDGSDGADFTLGITIPARISFAPGAVSATVDGQIVNHYATTYLLRAMQDQTMTVTITSDSAGLALTIYGLSDGQPLVRSHLGLTTWTGTLPATQDYVIMIVPSVDTADYSLTTTVE